MSVARKVPGAAQAATIVPLFLKLATLAQAHAVADTVSRKLLAPGGLATSLVESGQQWDAPNGWAPLQWEAVVGLRNYGFDVDTTMSSNRGSAFAKGRSFGHTGFTGTSIWVDLPTQTAVIFLSNRVHPDDKGDVAKLRGQVATLLESAMLGN